MEIESSINTTRSSKRVAEQPQPNAITSWFKSLYQNPYYINGFFLGGYLFIILTQYIYVGPVFEWSTYEFIPSLQVTTWPESPQWKAWKAYSSKAAGGITQIVFAVINIIFYDNSPESMFLPMAFAVELFLATSLKNFHQNPRPFWVNFYKEKAGDGVYPSICTSQFGNPSTHALLSSYFSMYLFFAYVINWGGSGDDNTDTRRSRSLSNGDSSSTLENSSGEGETLVQGVYDFQQVQVVQMERAQASSSTSFNCCTSTGLVALKFTAFVILATGWICVCFSRMVLGLHGMNQVIYGSLVGIWSTLYMVAYIRPTVKKHMELMQTKTLSQPDAVKLITIVGAFTVTAMLALLISFPIVRAVYKLP